MIFLLLCYIIYYNVIYNIKNVLSQYFKLDVSKIDLELLCFYNICCFYIKFNSFNFLSFYTITKKFNSTLNKSDKLIINKKNKKIIKSII